MMVFGFDVVGCVQSCLNNKYTNQVQTEIEKKMKMQIKQFKSYVLHVVHDVKRERTKNKTTFISI